MPAPLHFTGLCPQLVSARNPRQELSYHGWKGIIVVAQMTPAGVVTTLAGLAGSTGSSDGTSSVARFNRPIKVAVDSADTVYVADRDNNTIRKVTTPGGVVTTLGGLAGTYGSTDGTGSVARFNNPAGVAVDGAGNVYVADPGNHTLRKAGSPPVITMQPQSQVAVATSNVTFTVVATGSGLTYQWRKGVVDMGGEAGTTLTLSSVTRAASGVYSVLVTGSGGSTPSSDATLRVIVPQRLQPPQRTGGGQWQLLFTDPDNAVGSDLSRFEVHHTANFLGASTVWVTNSGSFTLSNGKILFDHTGSVGTARRFYRVIEK